MEEERGSRDLEGRVATGTSPKGLHVRLSPPATPIVQPYHLSKAPVNKQTWLTLVHAHKPAHRLVFAPKPFVFPLRPVGDLFNEIEQNAP